TCILCCYCVMADGTVISSAGSSIFAKLCTMFNKNAKVVVCCESFKKCDHVLRGSFANEILEEKKNLMFRYEVVNN
ncbi:MAG: hypothetical protein MHPSP_004314, partial [Paramarteilia canceri]